MLSAGILLYHRKQFLCKCDLAKQPRKNLQACPRMRRVHAQDT